MKKRNKITERLDASEFRRFEAYCFDRGHEKSTLIAHLVRGHLDGEGFTMQEELPLSAPPAPATASRRPR